MSITSIKAVFDEWLGSINPNAYTKYNLRVGCVKMASPRDSKFDFIREYGYQDIISIFENKPFSSNDLTFVFPERHMSVHEQQAFMHKLEQHPDFEDIKSIDIITSSPLIIGAFRRESINILTWSNDSKYSGNP